MYEKIDWIGGSFGLWIWISVDMKIIMFFVFDFTKIFF